MVTERSVEEHVMAGAAKKIEMDKKIIQAGRYDNKSTAEERDAFLVRSSFSSIYLAYEILMYNLEGCTASVVGS